MNEHPSPEFEKKIRENLSAPNADPAFVHDLRATLIERSKMKNQTRSSFRLAWAIAIAILLIVLLVSFPRVVTALKQLLGYVPGLGYVEQGNFLRLLSAPVTIEKDGLTLTIEKGAADSQHTILLQHLEGYTPDRAGEPGCDTPARLVLADGTIINIISFETGHEGDKGDFENGKYYGRYVFAAMPAQVLDVTLEIPCIMYDKKYTDWKFQLHFEVADESQVAPVIEIPTDDFTSTLPTDPSTAEVTSTESTLEGFSIVFESETLLPDGYILAGSYRWTDPRFDGYSAYPIEVQLTDANGKEVNIERADPIEMNTDPTIKKLPFALHIIGKDYAFPLTASVESIVVTLSDTATFQFDAGPNPQVGQVWDVDIDVPVGEHIIHVQTIELIGSGIQIGFNFTMTSDPLVIGAGVTDPNPIIINGTGSGGGGGGGGGSGVGPFESGWALDGYSPSGVKTFVISNLSVAFHGTWQVTWRPTPQ